MDINKAFETLEEVITYNLRHEHYDRTVEIAENAYMYFTGEGQDRILKDLREGETDYQKRNRVKLTNSMTPVVLNPVLKLFKRPHQNEDVVIDYKFENDQKHEAIREALEEYHAREGVSQYLEKRLLYLNFVDPNAFILTNFSDVRNEEGAVTDIKPYPVEIRSENAIVYEYINGELRYLIFNNPRVEVYEEGSNRLEEDVEDFYMFFPGFSIELREYVHELPEEGTEVLEIGTKEHERRVRTFVVQVLENKTTFVPAKKVGVYADSVTGDANVYVTPFDKAEPLLNDIIRDKSYLDVTKDKHVYPYRIQYVPPCDNFQEGQYCHKGYIGDQVCNKCDGKGYLVPVSSQQAQYLKFMPPETKEDAPLPDLSNLLYDVPADVTIPQYLGDELEKHRRLVFLSIFNSENVEQPFEVSTATEIRVNYQEVNDTVSDYASKGISAHFVFIHAVAAEYFEAPDFYAIHNMPKDLNLKDVSTLVSEYQQMRDAGLGDNLLWPIKCKILQKIYRNDINIIENIKAKHRFLPFRSHSEMEIATILQNRPADDYDRVLWEDFDNIMRDVDKRVNTYFYQVDETAQERIVDEVVQEYMARREVIEEPISNLPFSVTDEEEDRETAA